MLEKDTGGLCSITTLHHSHHAQFAHARKTFSASFEEFAVPSWCEYTHAKLHGLFVYH